LIPISKLEPLVNISLKKNNSTQDCIN
jgi:hypothetical protein